MSQAAGGRATSRRGLRVKSRRNRLTEGKNFVITSVPVLRDGIVRRSPRLFVLAKDVQGAVDAVPIVSLDEYFDDNSARSPEWQRQTAFGLGLLIDHTFAVMPHVAERLLDAHDGILERHLLRTFAHDTRDGTMPKPGDGGTDRLGLYWRAKGHHRTDILLKRLTAFFSSLGEKPFDSRWGWASNPNEGAIDPMASIRMVFELAIRKARSLLGYLKGEAKTPPHRFSGVVKPKSASTAAPKSFPAQWIVPFLTEGFTNEYGRTDETAQLLAYELFLTGLRRSEPLHHFVSDVQFVEDSYQIFLHDPVGGKVIYGGVTMTRRDYLLSRYKIIPRTEEKPRVGFKGLLDDDKGTQVYWLPIPEIKTEFDRLLRKYIQVTRPALMLKRPSHLKDHPFLYVSSGFSAESGGREIGDPYTIAAFIAAWQAAIRRTARRHEIPDFVCSKPLGTTPHGLRHHFGRYLVTLGIDLETIRQTMHHKSIESTRVYTRLTPREVDSVLKRSANARADEAA